MTSTTYAIDGARLASELETLATISEAAPPAVTRVVFGDADLRARAYVKTLCRGAGLDVREDAVGNMFARLRGSAPERPAIATGSHIDAIPNAGKYDGTVGVLGGLEALRALTAGGFRPARSIDLILFTSEEPTRFGIGCLGSRLLSGVLDETAGERLIDAEGRTLNDARAHAGFMGPLGSVRLPPGMPAMPGVPGIYDAFIELHIEQGPLLEQRGLDIGIVTAIAAPAGLRIAIEGEGGHAGAVLMPDRRDAFLAAAEIALAVEAAAIGTGAIDTVGTVGVCEVFPGAVNSVPSRSRLEVDVRDIDEARRNAVLNRIADACADVAARRRVRITQEIVNADRPAVCAPDIADAIARASDALELASERMISRAYHDALFMSRVAPTAMIFVPSRGGISHRPDEYSSPDAIARGVAVLAGTLAQLSS
jgi:ureidoglycolate amidohydrolase